MCLRAGRVLVPIALLAVLAATTGCGGKPVHGEVEGVVRLNGQPLPNVFVQFLPETSGPRSSATTDEQGHYQLLCDNNQSGAVAGWHRVVLLDLNAKRAAEGRPLPPNATRVPLRYGNALTTPLVLEVRPGSQTLPLDIEPQ